MGSVALVWDTDTDTDWYEGKFGDSFERSLWISEARALCSLFGSPRLSSRAAPLAFPSSLMPGPPRKRQSRKCPMKPVPGSRFTACSDCGDSIPTFRFHEDTCQVDAEPAPTTSGSLYDFDYSILYFARGRGQQTTGRAV